MTEREMIRIEATLGIEPPAGCRRVASDSAGVVTGGRRVPRTRFDVLAAASLLVCVITTGLCVRSYSIADYWAKRTDGPPRFIEVSRGWLAVVDVNGRMGPDRSGRRGGWRHAGVPPATAGTTWILQDFLYWDGAFPEVPDPRRWNGTIDRTRVVIPLHPVAVLSAVAPLVWGFDRLRRYRDMTRSRAGLCAQCGYDLRASPDRCPECGAVPAR